MNCFVLFAFVALVSALDNGLALTPPMVFPIFILRFIRCTVGLDALGTVPMHY